MLMTNLPSGSLQGSHRLSLWKSQNTIFKCYSAAVAGNSASAKMQNSQMVQSLEIVSDLGAEKISNFLQRDLNSEDVELQFISGEIATPPPLFFNKVCRLRLS